MESLLSKRNVLVLLAILFFLIAWNRGINLLYGMFALLSAVLILAHILPRYSIRMVSASRKLPVTACEGDFIDIVIEVCNNGFTGRSMIEVVDTFPASEPGSGNPMTFIARLNGGEKRRYTFQMLCYKRGEYRIGPLALTSSYPLGISEAGKVMEDSERPFLVYPEIFNIATFPLSSGRMPMCGIEASSKAGGGEEFFGTREYRQGDSLKFIHWPSTARQSKLIVKEFEIHASVEVAIVIDLHKNFDIGERKDTTLEYAVKIAASVANYAIDRGHAVQLTCIGKNEHVLSAAKGHSQLALILDMLARIRSDGDVFFPGAVNRASEYMRDGGTAVLVFSQSLLRGKDMAYSFDLLRAKRIQPVCVILDDDSFRGAQEARNSPGAGKGVFVDGVRCYRISRGDSLTEAFVE